jgi:hypothetical protein
MAKEQKAADEKLETVQSGALARPDFVAPSTEGTEHITSDEMQLPRITVAQQMSHELNPAHASFIDGLKVQDMFNTLSHKVYGKGPLHFIVLRADPPRFMEFFPRDMGGGVKDYNVPANDPRTQFTRNEQGSSVPPVATKFYDFIVMLHPSQELAALSFKGMMLKAGRKLNGLMKMRNAPIYAGLYKLDTAMETNKKGVYAVMTVDNAGWVPDQETYKNVEAASRSLQGKAVVIDREPGMEEEATFETSEM